MERIPQDTTQRIFDRILIGIFLIMLTLPAIGLLSEYEKPFQEDENRAFAQMPPTNWLTLYRDGWRQAVEKYFNDNFGGRGRLVRLSTLTFKELFNEVPITKISTANILGTQAKTETNEPQNFNQDEAMADASVVPDTSGKTLPSVGQKVWNTGIPWIEKNVLYGKDGWMFLDKESVIDDYRNLHPFTQSELETVRKNLQAKKDWLAGQGIEFVVIVAPNTHTIYSEFLPDKIKKVNDVSKLDQVIAYMQGRSDVTILDVRPEMFEKKKEIRVYDKTGTHWNHVGAFVAYTKLMDYISSKLPNAIQKGWSDYSIVTSTVAGRDLATMLSLQNALKEEAIDMKPRKKAKSIDASYAFADPNPSPIMNPVAKEVPDSSAPRLLMFKDSFGSTWIPFVAESFSRSVFVPTHEIIPSIVEAEKPDVVVLEIVERKLYTALVENLSR